MSENQDLVLFGKAETPVAVLQDAEKYSAFYARIKKEMDAFVPDLTTIKGRNEIKAQAFKVTKTKTAVEDARKLLTEEARKLVDKANAAGKIIREQLDDLAKEVRRPLTEWEEAEDARVKRVEDVIASIRESATVEMGLPSGYISDRLESLSKVEITDDEFQSRAEHAREQLAIAKAALTTLLAQAQQAERDASELEKLREEARQRKIEEDAKAEADRLTEQVKREEEDRLKRESDAKAKTEADALAAKESEEKRVADAAAKARQDEIDKAARLQEEKDAAHAKEIADRDAEIERQRLQREAEEKTKADEQAAAEARAKDRAHKGRIMGEAKVALITCGIDEAQAKAIVTAIVAGLVPHIRLEF